MAGRFERRRNAENTFGKGSRHIGLLMKNKRSKVSLRCPGCGGILLLHPS